MILDPVRARQMAAASIDFQRVTLTSAEIVVAPDGSTVAVSIQAALELGLFGIFIDDDRPLEVAATAVAGPQRVP